MSSKTKEEKPKKVTKKVDLSEPPVRPADWDPCPSPDDKK